MRTLQQFDRGVVLSLALRDEDGVALTLDGNETAVVLLESPTGKRKTLSATVDVAAQAVRAVTAELDFDEWGEWRIQAKVTATNYEARGQVTPMLVRSNIDAPRLVVALETATFWISPGSLGVAFV